MLKVVYLICLPALGHVPLTRSGVPFPWDSFSSYGHGAEDLNRGFLSTKVSLISGVGPFLHQESGNGTRHRRSSPTISTRM
jgi:hypothetical protein